MMKQVGSFPYLFSYGDNDASNKGRRVMYSVTPRALNSEATKNLSPMAKLLLLVYLCNGGVMQREDAFAECMVAINKESSVEKAIAFYIDRYEKMGKPVPNHLKN